MANFEDAILRDTFANRPAAGITGRLFYDTTNEKWQRDSGTTWEDCEPAAGTSYTDEQAQDAVGGIVDATLTYDDATPSLGVSDVLNLPTAEVNTSLVLAPDGAGGVEFRAETGGGGGGVVYPKSATIWHHESRVISGNALTKTINSGQIFCYWALQNPPANGDELENGFFLAAGTYTFNIYGVKGSDGGKMDFSIDGGSVFGTLDNYNGATLSNALTSISSVVVSTDGYHKLGMKVNGKNASSSSYIVSITKMWFAPSAF